jgi:hypothetical protein
MIEKPPARQPDILCVAKERGRCTLVAISDEHVEPRAIISWDPKLERQDSPDLRHRHDRHLKRLHGQVQFIWGEERQPTQVYRSGDMGRTLSRLEPLPDPGLPVDATCPDGTLLALDGWGTRKDQPSYYVRRPNGPWIARPLPRGFEVGGVSCAPDGTVYVAGGYLPGPAGTNARPPGGLSLGSAAAPQAVLIDDGVNVRLETPRCTAETTARIVCNTTAAWPLKGIDATAAPHVLRLSYQDCGHDAILVEDDPCWNLAPRVGPLLQAICRESPGVVTLYYLGCQRARTRDRGRTWTLTNIADALRAAWPLPWSPKDVVPHSVDARGSEIVASITGYDDHRHLATLIFTSVDDGETFVARPVPDDIHVGEVCLQPLPTERG